jgi:hypothetical protein
MPNKERLRELVALLRADAENPEGVRFNLATWISYSIPDTVPTDMLYTRAISLWPDSFVPSISCNTTACAGGLAAMHPPFQEQGLSFTISYKGSMTPTYEGKQDYVALAHFFDIPWDITDYFFSPNRYHLIPVGKEGELVVAGRIEDYLNTLP